MRRLFSRSERRNSRTISVIPKATTMVMIIPNAKINRSDKPVPSISSRLVLKNRSLQFSGTRFQNLSACRAGSGPRIRLSPVQGLLIKPPKLPERENHSSSEQNCDQGTYDKNCDVRHFCQPAPNDANNYRRIGSTEPISPRTSPRLCLRVCRPQTKAKLRTGTIRRLQTRSSNQLS